MRVERPNVLLFAASDSSGGSGLQADLRVCAALGVHPLTVLTAVTAQGATGLRRRWGLDAEVVGEQLEALADLPIAAVKIGVLATAAVAEAVAGWLAGRRLPVVVDPVLATSGGEPLADAAAVESLTRRLLPAATLVTPNLGELARLSASPTRGRDERVAAARRLGCAAVLVKDGHGSGALCEDLLVTADAVQSFRHRRHRGSQVRGTGCALATAVAAGLARGEPLGPAVKGGIDYVQNALETASPLGGGVAAL